ncbi:MAG TPA: ATP-binding protein [Pseudonocardiaceae bacterium]|jgi:signal transduction histidine kinase|nr:ATP-binding protein [Pseudonocardiaceae bacterium]
MRRRILLAILLAVAVTACALGVPLGYTAMQMVETLTESNLLSLAQRLATSVNQDLDAGRQPNLAQLSVIAPPGGEITLTLPGQAPRKVGPHVGTDSISESAQVARDGTIGLAEPAGPMRRLQAEVAVFVVLLVVLSISTGTVVATVTARRLTEPMRHVADRAIKLGAGDFKPDGSRYGVPELDLVADALDTSASALALLVQRERELVGDVSHQLRSRLTALQLRLETLAVAANEETAEDATAALDQAERLAQVLDELLAAASAARAAEAQPVNLALRLPAMVAEWRELLRAQGRTLRLRVPEGLLARATPGRLRESLGVLLDNSLKYGTGTVQVSARRGDGMVLIEVSDAGPGVPDELAAHVFERGVSGGGSTGVGLALARALVDADGGRLELAVLRPPTFALFLPVAKAEDVVATPWRTEVGPR